MLCILRRVKFLVCSTYPAINTSDSHFVEIETDRLYLHRNAAAMVPINTLLTFLCVCACVHVCLLAQLNMT